VRLNAHAPKVTVGKDHPEEEQRQQSESMNIEDVIAVERGKEKNSERSPEQCETRGRGNDVGRVASPAQT
jgi:hypothetical protein